MATSKTRSGQPLLNIVVPVYNEAENFRPMYEEVEAKIKIPHRLIVVYDFDEDTTVPVAREIAKKDPKVELVKNTIGRGALNAVKTGFNHVKTGPVLVVMADLADDLKAVNDMYDHYLQGAHLVAGSRYMKGGKQIGGPLLKRTMSRIAGTSLHYLRGIPTHDTTNNFKLYDKKLLDNITIESKGGFEVAMEVTVKAFLMGATIKEVPSTWKDRTAGESNFKLWKWLPSYLHWYFYAYHPKTNELKVKEA
jgi:dolichol-phosphate mannosyltransferase